MKLGVPEMLMLLLSPLVLVGMGTGVVPLRSWGHPRS